MPSGRSADRPGRRYRLRSAGHSSIIARMIPRARAFVARNGPPLVAAVATTFYAVATLGFGLNFRPLHHDEGVTLAVAAQSSVADVLHTAIHVRHGPPLDYLVVHAALSWHDDVFGLRLPSALFG